MGTQLKQLQAALYKKLTGTNLEDNKTDGHERQQMLAKALLDKQRALLVLDDPWKPEQVRLLNPIDSTQQTEHRLLVTTRIRDLVPKATRLELPLMDKVRESMSKQCLHSLMIQWARTRL